MADKLALPCDCAGTCSIALVMEFEARDDEPQEFFVEFYTSVGHGRGDWRDRLRIAWGVLRKKEPYVHSLCWTDPTQPEALRDFLNDKLPKEN